MLPCRHTRTTPKSSLARRLSRAPSKPLSCTRPRAADSMRSTSKKLVGSHCSGLSRDHQSQLRRRLQFPVRIVPTSRVLEIEEAWLPDSTARRAAARARVTDELTMTKSIVFRAAVAAFG